MTGVQTCALPILLGLLQLQHPLGPGQVVHLLEGLHLPHEGAAGRVLPALAGWSLGEVGEAGLDGHGGRRRLGAPPRGFAAEGAAGVGVVAAGGVTGPHLGEPPGPIGGEVLVDTPTVWAGVLGGVRVEVGVRVKVKVEMRCGFA